MMKRILILAGCLAVATVIAGMMGCDTQSADSPITISPSSATLSSGQAATFTANGGFEYTWALSTDGWGTLNRRTGSSVTYTAFADPAGDNQVVTLTVTSFVPGAGTGATNGTTPTAEAFIQHLGVAAE